MCTPSALAMSLIANTFSRTRAARLLIGINEYCLASGRLTGCLAVFPELIWKAKCYPFMYFLWGLFLGRNKYIFKEVFYCQEINFLKVYYDETTQQMKHLGWWGMLKISATRKIMSGSLRYCLHDNVFFLPEDEVYIWLTTPIVLGYISREELFRLPLARWIWPTNSRKSSCFAIANFFQHRFGV